MLKRFNDKLTTIEEYIGLICLVIMLATILLQVVVRSFANHSFSWTEELARYLMIISIGFGIAVGVSQRAHVGIQAIVDKLPTGVHKIIIVLTDAISCAIFLFMSVVSWQLVQIAMQSMQLTPALRFPIYFVYLGMFIPFLLCALHQAIEVVFSIQALGDPKEHQKDEEDAV